MPGSERGKIFQCVAKGESFDFCYNPERSRLKTFVRRGEYFWRVLRSFGPCPCSFCVSRSAPFSCITATRSFSRIRGTPCSFSAVRGCRHFQSMWWAYWNSLAESCSLPDSSPESWAFLLAGEMARRALESPRLCSPNHCRFTTTNSRWPLAVAAFALATFGAGPLSLDQAISPEGRKSSRKAKSRD